MLKSKVFVKKTKRGNILKIVREHYLRDDITCGSEICEECVQENDVLQSDFDIESDQYEQKHYIIPDTNVVIHQVCINDIIHIDIRTRILD